MRAPLVRERLDELADAALRGGVRGDGEPALEGEERGEVDDGAAPPREHVRAGGLREEERGFEVRGEDLGARLVCVGARGTGGIRTRASAAGALRALRAPGPLRGCAQNSAGCRGAAAASQRATTTGGQRARKPAPHRRGGEGRGPDPRGGAQRHR